MPISPKTSVAAVLAVDELTVARTMTLNLGHSPVSNSYTVYGSAPPGQNSAIGSYTDVLLTTVTY
jgi:spore coat protein U-like protein